MQTDLETLKRVVGETARKSSVGQMVEGVELESARDGDGDEFLRVMIRLKSSNQIDHRALAKLVGAIEDAVGELDERYPSVRFPDAA